MRKTFASIQRHVDADAGYLPLRSAASGCWESLPEVRPADAAAGTDPSVAAIDEAVREADPDVVVANSLFRRDDVAFVREYPLVHVRHGSSVGRSEVRETTAALRGMVDVALAPGEYWATRYREAFADDVRTPVVGIPEADDLVGAEPPERRRVLYAPTNHNYGGGCYLETAEHVLDVFADATSDLGAAGAGASVLETSAFGTAAFEVPGRPTYELVFRPHPHDRTEEPGKSVTERCRERIAALPNVTFDDADSPKESMLDADILVSDYSGIVTEWLHTGRPLVQLTATDADADVPQLGYLTDHLSLGLLEELYVHGYPEDVERSIEEARSKLGIPMDGRAGERAATEVMACTQ